MRSSEALERIGDSLRAQKGTVAAIAGVALLYGGFLAVMAGAGTSVVEQFYARQRAWHVGKLEELARAAAETPGVPLPVELPGPALQTVPSVRTFGFFPPDKELVWTQQRLASMALRLAPPPETDLLLTFAVQGVLAPSRPSQRVSLEVGGQPAASWTLERRDAVEEFQLRVPRERLRPDGVLTLVFHVEDPRARSALGAGWDHRQLGVGLVSLRIAAAR